MRVIKVQLIKKYQDFMQEYVDLIKKHKGQVPALEVKLLTQKHSVCATTKTDMLKLNFIKRISRGVYVVNIDKIEPIHVRRIIEYRREYMRNSASVKRVMGNLTKSFQDKQPIEPIKLKKTISILWGLFKINY
jgi:hypothetical protein